MMPDNGETIFKIPGYCIKLGELLDYDPSMNSALMSKSCFYKVNFNTANLKSNPFPDEGIVGWRGPAQTYINNPEVVIKSFNENNDETTKMLIDKYGDGNLDKFMHNIVRSIKPGIFNSNIKGENASGSGLYGEVIINIPCKMMKITSVEVVKNNIRSGARVV